MSDALEVRLSATASYESSGRRLDQVAAELFPQYSRSRLQSWIRSGQLLVNGEVKAAKFKLQGGEALEIQAELEAEGDWKPEPIELDIIYEDRHIAVINKPAGLVVHPAAGNRDGTLLNALLHRYPEVETVPRAGIVHRLDKDTTGLMVVARTLEAQTELVRQLQARSVSREYEAVVVGGMTGGGIVDAPIGRHPVNRKKMAVTSDGKSGGKEARTHYSIIQRFDGHTHVRCKLETGRTHQIRVHMAHIHHPLVGDPVYGGRFRIHKGGSPQLQEQLRLFPRQALHARRLGLIHPHSGSEMAWESELPDDFQSLLSALQEG